MPISGSNFYSCFVNYPDLKQTVNLRSDNGTTVEAKLIDLDAADGKMDQVITKQGIENYIKEHSDDFSPTDLTTTDRGEDFYSSALNSISSMLGTYRAPVINRTAKTATTTQTVGNETITTVVDTETGLLKSKTISNRNYVSTTEYEKDGSTDKVKVKSSSVEYTTTNYKRHIEYTTDDDGNNVQTITITNAAGSKTTETTITYEGTSTKKLSMSKDTYSNESKTIKTASETHNYSNGTYEYKTYTNTAESNTDTEGTVKQSKTITGEGTEEKTITVKIGVTTTTEVIDDLDGSVTKGKTLSKTVTNSKSRTITNTYTYNTNGTVDTHTYSDTLQKQGAVFTTSYNYTGSDVVATTTNNKNKKNVVTTYKKVGSDIGDIKSEITYSGKGRADRDKLKEITYTDATGSTGKTIETKEYNSTHAVKKTTTKQYDKTTGKLATTTITEGNKTTKHTYKSNGVTKDKTVITDGNKTTVKEYAANGSVGKEGTYNSDNKTLTVKEYGTIRYTSAGRTQSKRVQTKEITYSITGESGSLSASKTETTLGYNATGVHVTSNDQTDTSTINDHEEVTKLLADYLPQEESAS